MKKSILTVCAIALSSVMYSQIYMAKTCEISFYSHSPIEDIRAVNKSSKPVLKASTGEFRLDITMTGFVFEKPLMQEHFNENYLESDKFPYASFKGKIDNNNTVDYTKDGEYKVKVTGKFTIHGVEQERTIDATLSLKGGAIAISTKFNLHVADYKIKVPTLYVANIAEDVEVKLNADLILFK